MLKHCTLSLPVFVLLFVSFLTDLSAATRISIVNSNTRCSGFNDPTPASASGGNYGMTMGQQRLNAFQYAANLIAQHLVGSTEIRVDAQMNALGGSRYSAVLGQAGPMSVARDFSGAPVSNTYYPIALAEAIYGADLNNGSDIVAEFNSDLDSPEVLGSYSWFYGFNQTGGGNIDYVTVVMHELYHGLGFLSLLNQGGEKFNGLNDSYLLKLEGHSYSPSNLKDMNNSQRASVMTENGNLHWVGNQVMSNSDALYGGVDGNKHVFMYAPLSYSQGSSVSHFSTMLSPNEGMEPYYTGPNHKPGLAIHLLKDIGWNTTNGSGTADLHLALTDSGNNSLGDNNTYTLTVTNNGTSTAVEAMVTYMLPHGHEYVSAVPDNGSCYYTNRIVNCRLGDIASMASQNVQLNAKMNAAGSHVHAAVISSATRESNYLDNRIYRTATVSGVSDISLQISPSAVQYEQGSNYGYIANIINNGPSAATNLAVQINLPAGISFVGNGPDGCCSSNGDLVTCHIPELKNQQVSNINFIVNAANIGSYTSTASVTQNQSDPETANNNASLNINIKEEDEDECFIATAAFGSLLENEVVWLRRFRDVYLRTNSPGRIFINWYYQTSPPIAKHIRRDSLLRALMRGSLGPLVVLSRWLITSREEE